MPKRTVPLPMSSEQRRTLEAWVRAQNSPQGVALRARIALLAADGLSNSRIAREVGVSRVTATLWRQRFLRGGPGALTEIAPGRGRRVTYGADRVNAVVQATIQTKPPGATHWSTRTMAKAQGISKATVQRIWSAHGLQPHRTKRFKLSKDRRFTTKLTDVVGLYLNPPDKAVVLCVDEKSQIQALQRTQPGLPMKRGRCGTMTHDYKRHGTTTLFAALNVLEGWVIGECMPRHRHQEFLRFLRRLDRELPKDLGLHLIVDNYGTHTQAKVKQWLARHPRFTLHFTPTSSSWLNLVERWFRELTEKRVRRGSFCSVSELIAAIEEYLAAANADPKPFVWHASVQAILDKIAHCRAIYETLH
ncbi:MAG: IS630 family transposase [Chloroflexota bacterium]